MTAARHLSLRGWDALHQQKWSDAESLLGEALKHCPADERAQWGYAEVLWRRGQTQPAIEHMVTAVDTSGGNPDLAVRLGQMYFEQNQMPQAIEQAEAAIRAQRSHAGAWALRGDIHKQQRQLEQALECYHKSLYYRPDNPQIDVCRAEIYRHIGRPQRALGILDHLEDNVSAEKIPPRAWLLMGLTYADLGEQSQAEEYLQLAAHRAGDSSDLLLELAEAQYMAGDLAEARLCLGRVMVMDGQNAKALQLQTQLDQSFAQLAENNSGLPATPVSNRRRVDAD